MKKFLFCIIIIISCISIDTLLASPNSINDEDANSGIKTEDMDGVLIIYNNNLFQGNSIFIKYQKPLGILESVTYPEYLKLFVIGEDSNGKSHMILKDVSYNTKQGVVEYKIESSLSKYKKIIITGTNGKIMSAKVSKKKNTFILTILRWDSENLSSLYKKALEETKAEQEAKQEEKQKKKFEEGEDRYNSLLTYIAQNGSVLYDKLVTSDESLPIFVNSYKTENDYLDAVNVYITFENTSKKTIKYVDFEVIPYNRVDDITYSTIDHVSKKIIQVVDYISPSTRYTAKWKAVWFNNSISYMKINSIKITYSDNSIEIIENNKIPDLYKTKELKKEVYKDSEREFYIIYNIGDNKLYLEMHLKNDSEGTSYSVLFNSEPYIINGKRIETYECLSTSYERFLSKGNGIYSFSLDYEPNNYEILAGVKSGEIKQTTFTLNYTQMTPDNINDLLNPQKNNNQKSLEKTPTSVSNLKFSYSFTEDQLKFLRDCVCIKYYRNLKK
jgi:hypothetical protein